MNNGTVKLGDLGLSKQLSKYTLFHTESKIGTPIYTAPEILALKGNEGKDNGRYYSFPIDIWSLGVTFCQLMSLEIPFVCDFGKKNIYENIKNNKKNEKILNNDKSKYNDDIIKNYSAEFLELIDWMLTIDPKNRPSAQQILEKEIVRERMNSFIQENDIKSDISEINKYIEKEKNKNLIDFENKDDDLNIKIEDIGNEVINNEENIKIISAQEEKIKYDIFRQISLIDKNLKKVKTYK